MHPQDREHERTDDCAGHRCEQGNRVRDRGRARRAGLERRSRSPGRGAPGRRRGEAACSGSRRLRSAPRRDRRRERRGRRCTVRGTQRAARRAGQQRRRRRGIAGRALDRHAGSHASRGGDERDRRRPSHQRDAPAEEPFRASADRQPVQPRRVPDLADHAGHRPRRCQRRELTVQDVPQRGHGPVRQGAAGHQHQDQQRLSRVRRDRSHGFHGTGTPAAGAWVAVRLAMLPDDGPTGGLFDDAGNAPW